MRRRRSAPEAADAPGGVPAGSAEVSDLFTRLLARLGPQGWWPAETAEEMVVGAVLVQAVAWTNAQRAIDRLRAAGWLDLDRLAGADANKLAPLIRSAGYFNAKARKLVALAAYLSAKGGLPALRSLPAAQARAELLQVYGVGAETADAILCYALGKPAMVADAYARRVLRRIGVLPERHATGYTAARAYLAGVLPREADAAWLGEWHALLVAVGKQWCHKSVPSCTGCPAADLCRHRAAPA